MPAKGVLDTTLGFHIARAAVVAYGSFDVHIGRPYDLRKVDFSLLMMVSEHEGLTPKALAQGLSLTAPKLSMVLDRMQARGLIGRMPDPHDRRSVQVALTDQGAALAKRLAPVARRMEQGLKKRLTAADHALLIELLRKLAQANQAA